MKKNILDLISWIVLAGGAFFMLKYEDLDKVHMITFLCGFLLGLLIYKRNKKTETKEDIKTFSKDGPGGGGIKNPPIPCDECDKSPCEC